MISQNPIFYNWFLYKIFNFVFFSSPMWFKPTLQCPFPCRFCLPVFSSPAQWHRGSARWLRRAAARPARQAGLPLLLLFPAQQCLRQVPSVQAGLRHCRWSGLQRPVLGQWSVPDLPAGPARLPFPLRPAGQGCHPSGQNRHLQCPPPDHRCGHRSRRTPP